MDSGMFLSCFFSTSCYLLSYWAAKVSVSPPTEHTRSQSLRVCGTCLVCLRLMCMACVFTSCYYSIHKTALAQIQMVSDNPSFCHFVFLEILHGLNTSRPVHLGRKRPAEILPMWNWEEPQHILNNQPIFIAFSVYGVLKRECLKAVLSPEEPMWQEVVSCSMFNVTWLLCVFVFSLCFNMMFFMLVSDGQLLYLEISQCLLCVKRQWKLDGIHYFKGY